MDVGPALVVVSRPDSGEIVTQRHTSDVCAGQRTTGFNTDPFSNTAGQDVVVSVLVN